MYIKAGNFKKGAQNLKKGVQNLKRDVQNLKRDVSKASGVNIFQNVPIIIGEKFLYFDNFGKGIPHLCEILTYLDFQIL